MEFIGWFAKYGAASGYSTRTLDTFAVRGEMTAGIDATIAGCAWLRSAARNPRLSFDWKEGANGVRVFTSANRRNAERGVF
jgi:hypothetical protein